MVVLTVTALTYRSFTRSDMAISQREQQVIANAATPALDRARAKIEFVFNKDTRFSSGLPNSDFLASMMLATPYVSEVVALPGDPFTLPGETRLDINNDGKLDNAWSFRSDANGETIVYSILVDDEGTKADPTLIGSAAKKVTDPVNQDKASALITRTGPLATTEAFSNCANARAEGGWQVVNTNGTAQLQKNLQINVFVPNANNANRTVEAFEFQQSRIATRGNKWAAWFRYDMEVYPGRAFNINGAMHTDGSLMVDGEGDFTSYMISSHNSCVYSKLASEVTVGAANDGFEGQIVKGVTTYGGFGSKQGAANFHVWTTDNTAPVNQTLTTGNDSADGGNAGDLAVNPLVLFTQDKLQHTDADWNERDNDAWNGNAIRSGERVRNKEVTKPFVDDFFRADNRWGPKPRYGDTDALDLTSVDNTNVVGDNIPTTNNLLAGPIKGLDGYWERQATEYGLRLIVGERLELGNPSGWNYNPSTKAVDPTLQDRLYPPNAAPTVNSKIGANEYRQKRTLRDNLAAVQSMVVYHYDHSNGGSYPAACVAMTAHPGIPQTISNSRTFQNIPGTTTLNANFLNGTGTNGWEFGFYPETGVDSFGSSVGDPTSNLGKALRNLAHFAGDPNGGAPSFPPVQDPPSATAVVHPFPYMAMWGDFSPLRRIFDDYLDATTGAVTYANLSSADRATLHSAACTLGMLAFNLQNASNFTTVSNLSLAAAALGISNQEQMRTQIAKPIWSAFGGENGGPVAGSPAQGCVNLGSNNYDCTEVRPTRETLIDLAGLTANQTKYVDLIGELTQVDRDRTDGFQQSKPTETYGEYEVQKGSIRYLFRFPDNCHPNNLFGPIGPLFDAALGAGGQTDERAAIALICATRPKYPSLFYLFPKTAHGQRDGQPLTEEFINPTKTAYILNAGGTAGANFGVDYQPVEPSTVALAPRPIASWQTPQSSAPSGTAFNPQNNHIIDGSTTREVAFLDKGMFDGREQMGIRVLDIDLKKLTSTRVPGGTDTWLSDIACVTDTQDCDVFTEGIVYAFREDAVREDEIVRPKTSAANSNACLTVADVISAACRMVTTPGAEKDPPLTPERISLKPVDFVADPDRRPHGFRLRNGTDMSENKNRVVGMTFVTDNSVYVLGDFNLHSTGGTTTTLIEEFNAKLAGINWTLANFYNGRTEVATAGVTNPGFDPNFAKPALDTWRPVEILADAFTILSADFIDGDVDDTFTIAKPTTAPLATNTSYMNQSRPNTVVANLIRENGATSPVWIDRNGSAYAGTTPVSVESIGTLTWTGTKDSNPERGKNARLVTADNTYVNAVFIGGIVPSRLNQSYGGLQNFPRMLEMWESLTGTPANNQAKNLNMAGAFFQLNFATAATGPYDQDAWEPGDTLATDEKNGYYRAPARRWGYDPGLLYYPPAAAARRFLSLSTPRSEYYRELPADDPYIVNLRCAKAGSPPTTPVFDASIQGNCPTTTN